jgi:transforming growth factor-beta-induced protein
VITIPDVTTFATGDPTFEILVQALTRDDQPDFVGTLSSFETPAPFTVFAPTNDAFAALLTLLGVETLADIEGPTLTSVLNTHVIAGSILRSNNLPSGTVETLGETFELNGTIITDQNGRDIEIVVTDVQAGNGVVHVVSSVILPDLN